MTAALLTACLVTLSAAACGAPANAPNSVPGSATTVTARSSNTVEYLPGRPADVYLPKSPREAGAVVLLVPGGGWQTADRTGLGPLAARLAGAGIAAVNITYRASGDGVVFPAPVEDIACAAAFAAKRAATAAGHPVKLVILGHSAGAQLGALAALSNDRFRAGCPYPSATADGFVGLSGPYDIRVFADVAVALFGVPPDKDVQAWREGDPLHWVASAPRRLNVLLVHGDADTVVPPNQSEGFAAALTRAGLVVELRMVKGADHLSVFQPSVVATTVITWIRGLVTGS